MTELRVNKGYTYGIRSFATGNAEQGQFGVGTSVRTNVTLESLSLINEILGRYSDEMTEEELAQTKDALLRGQALKNETLGDKLGLVQEITRFNLPYDAKSKNMEIVQAMELEKAKSVLDTHVRPEAMHVVVVGDAATQLERLEKLGFGKPVLLNE
jgi:zinc protease